MVQLVILVVLLTAGTFLFRSYLEHRLKADLQRRGQEKTTEFLFWTAIPRR